tara:strand:- start:3204 stop:3482 length:279 start_codon:yes stop_codon:yes gene_type:complete
MKLTGKCKEDFEEWYTNPLRHKVALHRSIKHWETFPESMQYGVIVDFSETVEYVTNHKMVEAEQSYINGGHSRPESRIMTVEKFDKRYNQNK